MDTPAETKKELTFDVLKEHLDKSYHLVYVDYREDLNDHMDEIQTAIQTGEMDSLYEVTDGYYDFENELTEYPIKELKKELVSDGFDEEDVNNAVFDNLAELQNEIYERDTSTPLKDLIRNTPDQAAFYPVLDEYIEECWHDADLFKRQVRLIKKAVKIPYRNKTYDRKIEGMLSDASYGGQLVVYFYADLSYWLNLDSSKVNRIEFRDPVLAIVDHGGGSGGDCKLLDHVFTKPFDRQNIFLDRTIKYNYTYEVCGMSSDWCSDTEVRLYKGHNRGATKKSRIHAGIDVDKMYKEAYDKGGCTFGDMDIRRHRGTYYLNEFPCGTHCPHCGTFWID